MGPSKRCRGPPSCALPSAGHIAVVVNPPAAEKYCYWTNDETPAEPDKWLEGAEQTPGSWWVDWGKWLAERSGKMVPARKPGGGKLKAIEDAPGSYVKVQPD